LSPITGKEKTLLIGLSVTVGVVVVFYSWIGLNALFLTLLMGYFAWYFYTWYKNFRWFINDEGLQLYSGVWGRKQTLLTWNKVQQVHMLQSPYQRSHQLASLTFITAGGHVHLPYIQLSSARQLADVVLYYVESRDESWM
jgi:membrane protein YdbS with pleckstrin-like domain